jgi:hypothetical protein
MEGLRGGARQALLEAIRASALLALVEKHILPASERPRLEFERRDALHTLIAYRNVGVDLGDLQVEHALMRRYLPELDAHIAPEA